MDLHLVTDSVLQIGHTGSRPEIDYKSSNILLVCDEHQKSSFAGLLYAKNEYPLSAGLLSQPSIYMSKFHVGSMLDWSKGRSGA